MLLSRQRSEREIVHLEVAVSLWERIQPTATAEVSEQDLAEP